MSVFLLCLLALSPLADDAAVDRDALSRGVSELVAPGCEPGPVSASGNAFVVMSAAEGKGRVPLFVGAQVERGRALAGGHEGFFSPAALNNPSNGRFLANALEWLGGKSLDGLRVGLLGFGRIADKLSAAKMVPSSVSAGNIQAALPGLDVVCMTQGALDDSPAAQIAVMRFVKSGHGLLIAGPAWGWMATHHGMDLLADQTANRMLVPYGICFEDGIVGEQFMPETMANPLFNAQGAIDALTRGGLSIADNATATMTIERSLEHELSGNSPVLTQIMKMAQGEPGGGVPSAKTPITNSTPFSRLKLWLDARRYREDLPKEIHADPSADIFPGPVAESAPRVDETVTVDTASLAWHGTGMYAAPGEVVTIEIPERALSSDLEVRIGTHTDSLWDLPSWPRFPSVSVARPLHGELTQIASPFGGLIYINEPFHSNAGKIEVKIHHAVRAARYVRGKTTDSEWAQDVESTGAPWAEFEGDP